MASRHLPALSVALLFSSLLASPVQSLGPVIASIEDIDHEDLYARRFALAAETEVEIEAVGSGWAEGRNLFAYPWILDLQSRKVVWRLDPQTAEASGEENNIRELARRRLPPGSYALYFSAYGGSFPIRKKVTLLKIFDLGSIKIDGKFPVAWDEYGDPSEWRAIVRAVEEDFRPEEAWVSPEEPDLGAVLRLTGLGDLTYRCAALEVTDPVRMRVLAIGEYAGSGRGFCDGAWILDRDRCERVWQMTLENTAPAGGAEKNRIFDAEVTFSAGRYLACCGTDDCHSYEAWNQPPPYDPESWGLTLIPVTTPAPGVVTVRVDPPLENLIVRHARVGDGAFVLKGFTLSHPAEVCVRGLGEKKYGEERLVDFGWIEDARSRDVVWTMEHDVGVYASGETRNRLVEGHVRLAPGSYYVGYMTDGSHSAESWRDHPPFDPDGWGITVTGAGREFSPAWVQELDRDALDRTVISLAPLRDNQRKSVRFEVPTTTRVRIIALGEGDDDEMYDYAWLTETDSNATVWRMRYEDTQHAGGARKNRRADRILTLAPGRYTLGCVTDGSHAFGDWNADQPVEAYRWGVTLIEQAAQR